MSKVMALTTEKEFSTHSLYAVKKNIFVRYIDKTVAEFLMDVLWWTYTDFLENIS